VFVLFKFVSFCLYVCHVFVCAMFVCLCVCIFVCLYFCMFVSLYDRIFGIFFILVCLFVCFIMFDCIWCKDSAESFDECVVSFIGDVNIWQMFFFFSIYKRLSFKGKKMFVFSLVLLLSKFLFSPMIIPNHDLEKTKYKKERKNDVVRKNVCQKDTHED